MNDEKKKLKKALIGSAVMFVMTTLGHILIYLANKDEE